MTTTASESTTGRGGTLLVLLGDPPAPAVERAVQRAGAPLTLLGIVPSTPEAQAALTVGPGNRRVTDLLIDARRRDLEARAEALGGDVAVAVVDGDVRAVIDAFVAGGHDRVAVVGPRTAAARLLIARLIDLCPGPVLVEAAPGREPGVDVIVAIDPDAAPELNCRLVETAIADARRTGGEVHLVHAWTVAGESELRGAVADLSEAALADHALAVEAAHRAAFADAAALAVPRHESDDPRLTRHLVQGEPAEVIGRLADRHRAGLVVTGSGGRIEIDQALGGSAARAMAENDHHAVLVLKPAGFRSPLVAG